MDNDSIKSIAGRYAMLISLGLIVLALGGLTPERVNTFKAAALAEAVALLLSNIALYVFTPDSFTTGNTRYAKVVIFLAVHLLVGLVYAGSYFVEFAPAGEIPITEG